MNASWRVRLKHWAWVFILEFEGVAGLGDVPELGGMPGVFTGQGCAKGKAAVHVLEGHHVTAQAAVDTISMMSRPMHSPGALGAVALGLALTLRLHTGARCGAMFDRLQSVVALGQAAQGTEAVGQVSSRGSHQSARKRRSFSKSRAGY